MDQIDMVDMMAHDSAEPGVITNEQLAAISALARSQRDQEQRVAELEKELDEAHKRLRKTSEVDLPSVMDEVGLESFTLTDGTRITVKETLYASISAAKKPAAAQWLLDNELGSLVKDTVSVPFEKGDHERAVALQDFLRCEGYEPGVAETINTASVKAAINELMEQGREVPLDLFGAYFVKRSRLESGGR